MMTRTTTALLMIIAVLAIALTYNILDRAGRYQLVRADYVTTVVGRDPGDAIDIDKQNLFKVDTVTGQVWQFQSRIEQGRIVENWIEIK